MQQRLFEIIWQLTKNGGATAGQLAERFGVSRRTIYRDIDALSGAGIPVYAERGKGGGIFLLPEFVLDKTLFSKDEQAQLVAHFEGLASLGTPDTDAVLEKLSALFGRQDSWLQVDFAPWGGGEESRQVFRLLRDAILRRRIVTFVYTGANGLCEDRRVEPSRIFFRGQGWYLHAFCLARQSFRFFKLNRMQNVAETEESFTPRPAPPAEEPYSGRTVSVRMRLGPELAFRATDEFGAGQLQQQEDGSFLVDCRFAADGNWLLGYLLSFGPGAEVLEPAWLRETVAEALQEMAELYAIENG